MARCPFAVWNPLKRTVGRHDCDKTQIILHTMGGHFRGTRATFELGPNDSTFMLALDGELHQLMESQKQANANLHANRSAISIETEDGSPIDEVVNRTPWTAQQLEVLVRLIQWCAATHNIPLERIATPTSPGVGFHMMFKDQFHRHNPWTTHADKVCPGTARSAQFDAVLLPALRAPGAEGGATGILGTQPINLVRDRHGNLVAPVNPPAIRRTAAAKISTR
jgi:hypothetical protein